mmetsp:Transcript_73370/g.202491  ORF Transcript_73370/g.202491 Transcript_73370/m.202491 type:complete len:622 (-) Transcript_73370:118-1983(-)
MVEEVDPRVCGGQEEEQPMRVTAWKEEDQDGQDDVQDDVGVPAHFHRCSRKPALGSSAQHLRVRAHNDLPQLQRHVHGDQGLQQEGDEEARGEGIPEEEVPQGPLHGVGLEDLQPGELLQGLAAGGVGVHAHHHVVGRVEGHGHVHAQVHEAGQEIEGEVGHLRRVLELEPRELRDRPAQDVHDLVADGYQYRGEDPGQEAGPLAAGVGEGGHVERVREVATQGPQAERQYDAQDAQAQPSEALAGRGAAVRPLDRFGLVSHRLQLADAGLLVVLVAQPQAAVAPASLHRLVPQGLRAEDDEGLVGAFDALQEVALPHGLDLPPARAEHQEAHVWRHRRLALAGWLLVCFPLEAQGLVQRAESVPGHEHHGPAPVRTAHRGPLLAVVAAHGGVAASRLLRRREGQGDLGEGGPRALRALGVLLDDVHHVVGLLAEVPAQGDANDLLACGRHQSLRKLRLSLLVAARNLGQVRDNSCVVLHRRLVVHLHEAPLLQDGMRDGPDEGPEVRGEHETDLRPHQLVLRPVAPGGHRAQLLRGVGRPGAQDDEVRADAEGQEQPAEHHREGPAEEHHLEVEEECQPGAGHLRGQEVRVEGPQASRRVALLGPVEPRARPEAEPLLQA